MPRGNQTGPAGQGPMTGRGLGSCGTGTAQNVARGYGLGMGAGAGRGRRNRFFQPTYAPYQAPSLEDEKKDLQNRLDEIDQLLKK